MATRKQIRNVENNAATIIESPATPAAKSTEPRFCLCGCGKAVIGKKARFVTGDDAVLKSRLLREARDESNPAKQQQAKQELAELGWSHFDRPTAAMRGKVERAAKAAQAEAAAASA